MRSPRCAPLLLLLLLSPLLLLPPPGAAAVITGVSGRRTCLRLARPRGAGAGRAGTLTAGRARPTASPRACGPPVPPREQVSFRSPPSTEREGAFLTRPGARRGPAPRSPSPVLAEVASRAASAETRGRSASEVSPRAAPAPAPTRAGGAPGNARQVAVVRVASARGAPVRFAAAPAGGALGGSAQNSASGPPALCRAPACPGGAAAHAFPHVCGRFPPLLHSFRYRSARCRI